MRQNHAHSLSNLIPKNIKSYIFSLLNNSIIASWACFCNNNLCVVLFFKLFLHTLYFSQVFGISSSSFLHSVIPSHTIALVQTSFAGRKGSIQVKVALWWNKCLHSLSASSSPLIQWTTPSHFMEFLIQVLEFLQ